MKIREHKEKLEKKLEKLEEEKKMLTEELRLIEKYPYYDPQIEIPQQKKKVTNTTNNPMSQQPKEREIAKEGEEQTVQEKKSYSNSHIKQVIQHQKEVAKQLNTIDLCFLVDCTDSMGPWIYEVSKQIYAVAHQVSHQFRGYKIRFGFVGYRDRDTKPLFEKIDFTEEPYYFFSLMSKVTAYGGGDVAEDVKAGLQHVCNLKWESAVKILFHIADAPCHGHQFHNVYNFDFDNYLNEDPTPQLISVFNQFHNIGISNYFFVNINSSTDVMIGQFKQLFGCNIEQLKLGTNTPMLLGSIIDSITTSVARWRK